MTDARRLRFIFVFIIFALTSYLLIAHYRLRTEFDNLFSVKQEIKQITASSKSDINFAAKNAKEDALDTISNEVSIRIMPLLLEEDHGTTLRMTIGNRNRHEGDISYSSQARAWEPKQKTPECRTYSLASHAFAGDVREQRHNAEFGVPLSGSG